MFAALAGLTTKVIIGTAAVALTGAGAVATVSAVSPASASQPVATSTPTDDATPEAPPSTPDATPEPSVTQTAEPGDDNGVDATPTPGPTSTPRADQFAISRDEAVAIAQARFPQGTLHHVVLAGWHGPGIWKVDLRAADGSRAKIWVDATDGTIVRERFKDAKHENSGKGGRDHAEDDATSTPSPTATDDSGRHGSKGGQDDSGRHGNKGSGRP